MIEWTYIAFVAILAATGGVVLWGLAKLGEALLQDKETYGTLHSWLSEPKASQLYARTMRAMQDWLNDPDRLGPRLLISWRAAGFCLFLAYLYPFLAILGGWMAGGPSEIGGVPLMIDSESDLLRWGRVLLLIGSILLAATALFIGIYKDDSFSDRADDRVLRQLEARVALNRRFASFIATLTRFAAQIFVATFASLVAIIGAVAIEGALAVSGAIVVAFAVAVTVAGGFPLSGAVAVTAAAAITVVTGGESSILVLWVFIPFLNAAGDTVSLGASRCFLAHLFPSQRADRPRLRGVVGYGVLDGCVALGLLVSMAALLPFAAEVVNRLTGDTLLDWERYAVHAILYPWSEGLAVTVMLLSTLLWTGVHLFIVFVAGLIELFAIFGRTLGWLQMLANPWPPMGVRVLVVTVTGLAGLGGTALVVGAFYLLLLGFDAFGTPAGLILFNIAEWAAALVRI